MALAIPAMIENVLQVFIGVVDTYFVSKIGTEAIAGVGITNLIMNVYIAFFIAIGVGTTAIVARSIGTGDTSSANNSVKQSMIIAIIIGLISGVINLIFSKRLFMILKAEQNIIQYALPYFLIVAVPSVFLSVMMVLSSSLRGGGDTKTPMKVGLIANIINAVLDYVLIFGILGFSGIGIVGAALATTVSRVVGVIILLVKLNNKRTKLTVKLFSKWKIDLKAMKSIIRIGLPAGIEKLIMRFGQLVYSGMIIKIGTSAYAAHNIAGTIESFSYLPGFGFAIAASTLVGQNLGAKKSKDAQEYALISNVLSTVFMMAVGVIFYVFAPFLAGIFTKDEEVLILVVSVLRIIALLQPFLSITFVITSALQGAGDTKFPMYSTLIGIWGVRVIGVYLLGIVLEMGLVGVWIAYGFDIFIRGIILMSRFLNGKWKEIRIET
ncbi:MATE family efflux transporter [Mycoplasmatota bacterium]|nr:MATE family efflux transporter [Mycoplasmatota bacterium]